MNKSNFVVYILPLTNACIIEGQDLSDMATRIAFVAGCVYSGLGRRVCAAEVWTLEAIK